MLSIIDMSEVIMSWVKEYHPELYVAPCHDTHPHGCDGLYIVIDNERIPSRYMVTDPNGYTHYHFLVELDFEEIDRHTLFIVDVRGKSHHRAELNVADPNYFKNFEELIALAIKMKNENFQMVS